MKDIPQVVLDFCELEENLEYMELAQMLISKCFGI